MDSIFQLHWVKYKLQLLIFIWQNVTGLIPIFTGEFTDDGMSELDSPSVLYSLQKCLRIILG